jgi:hypothetical protein
MKRTILVASFATILVVSLLLYTASMASASASRLISFAWKIKCPLAHAQIEKTASELSSFSDSAVK